MTNDGGNPYALPRRTRGILLLVLAVALVVLVPVGIALLVQDSRYAVVPFGLLGLVSFSMSVYMLVRASRGPKKG